MTKLLLISNSSLHGGGYLDHCADEIKDFFSHVRHVLFIPYALHNHTKYFLKVEDRFRQFGIDMDSSINQVHDPRIVASRAEAFFVGGGNTFRLLKILYDHELVEVIRARVLDGTPYVGVSAGANIACPTIKTTNDMPIVFPPSLEALNLVPFQINPHYLDPDPNSTYMGETRETRLREFHEENDLPVIGLREGSMLRIEAKTMLLKGQHWARIFRKGEEAQEIAPGSRLDSMLIQEF